MINLFDFTYCGDYNRQIQNLARMVPEKWSFSDTDDNGILKGYLEHTFKRLYEEQKVWEKKNYAIFNTGQAALVSGWLLYRILFVKRRNHLSAGKGMLCGKSVRSCV